MDIYISMKALVQKEIITDRNDNIPEVKQNEC